MGWGGGIAEGFLRLIEGEGGGKEREREGACGIGIGDGNGGDRGGIYRASSDFSFPWQWGSGVLALLFFPP